MTTGSLEALRKYSEALRLEEEDRAEEAIPLLEEAVALDSGFAMAWRKLAVILGNTEAPQSRQVAAATAAYRHRDRLPSLERDLTAGYYYAVRGLRPGQGDRRLPSGAGCRPGQPGRSEQSQRAVHSTEAVRGGREFDLPGGPARRGASFRQNLVNILSLQGRFAEARTAVEDYRRGSPESSFAVGLDGWLAASERDSPRAVDLFMQMRERNPDSRFYRLVTSRYLVTEYEKQGRLADARRIGREAMADAEAQGDSALYVEIAAQLAGLNLRYGSAPGQGHGAA